MLPPAARMERSDIPAGAPAKRHLDEGCEFNRAALRPIAARAIREVQMHKRVICAAAGRLAGTVAILAACASAGPAIAKPRGGGGYFGCSVAQIQSPAASACISEGDLEIVNGWPTFHRVVCSGGKMSCCEVDGNDRVVDGSCVTISGRPNPGQGIVAPNAGFSPSGIFTSPPHRGPVAPRPPLGGVKDPGGSAPPSGHRPPVKVGGFKPPSGVKTTGGNSAPATIERSEEHHSGGRHR